MVILEMAVGIILLSYLASKGLTNNDADKNEDQEHAENVGSVRHQFWQTMDLTEPWNNR